MRQTRREALGTIGGILGGFAFGRALPKNELSAEQLPESELEIPSELNETTAGEQRLPVETMEETITQPEVVEVREQSIEPRISPLLEAEIREKMLTLLNPEVFGAIQVFFEAFRETHNGDPLIETVHNTFRETLQQEAQFRNLDARTLDWFADICTYGQVTAESTWETTIGNQYSSAEGLWQILDIGRAQIDIERGPGRQMINRHDPVEATRGAAEYYDYTLRSLGSRVDEITELFDVNDTEFALPLLMTAYHSGTGPMHRGITSYVESNPDTNLVGLDVFADYLRHIEEAEIEGLNAHSPEYFMKCLALKRIYDAIPGLMK